MRFFTHTFFLLLVLHPPLADAQYYDLVDSVLLKVDFKEAVITSSGHFERSYTKDVSGRLQCIMGLDPEDGNKDSTVFTYTTSGYVSYRYYLEKEKTRLQEEERVFTSGNRDSMVVMYFKDTSIFLVEKRQTDTGLTVRYQRVSGKRLMEDITCTWTYNDQHQLVKYSDYVYTRKHFLFFPVFFTYNEKKRNCTVSSNGGEDTEIYHFNKKGELYRVDFTDHLMGKVKRCRIKYTR